MASFALPIPGYRQGVRLRKRRRNADTDAATGSEYETRTEQSAAEDSAAAVTEGEGNELPSSPPSWFPTPQPSSSLRSHLPSESINPLSHSPDTLRQLAVAGLAPEDDLPSRRWPGFPHRPIPSAAPESGSFFGGRRRAKGKQQQSWEYGEDDDEGRRRADETSGDDTEGEDGDLDPEQRRFLLGTRRDNGRTRVRDQHLGTMMTILHRCLAEGDMARARRAYGLILRTRGVDVRAGNLWQIGVEIIMRYGEEGLVNKADDENKGGEEDEGIKGEPEEEQEGADPGQETSEAGRKRKKRKNGKQQPPRRWGTVGNTQKAVSYLETLIGQFPHDIHRPWIIGAFDFWPALIGIEIYNLQAEYERSLWEIDTQILGGPGNDGQGEGEEEEEGDNSADPPSFSSSSSSDDDEDHKQEERELYEDDDQDPYNYPGSGGNGPQRTEKRRLKATRYASQDSLRSDTAAAARRIADRIDALFDQGRPWPSHHELLRQRGMLALWLGDLILPAAVERKVSRILRRRRRQGEGRSGAGGGGGHGGSSSNVWRDGEKVLKSVLFSSSSTASSSFSSFPSTASSSPATILQQRNEEHARARGFFNKILTVGGAGQLETWVKGFVERGDDDDDDLDEEEEDEEEEEEEGRRFARF